jgi:hypothetical protein
MAGPSCRSARVFPGSGFNARFFRAIPILFTAAASPDASEAGIIHIASFKLLSRGGNCF